MTTMAQRIQEDTAHAEKMRLADAAPDMLAALRFVRQFVGDEAENRSLAGSDMTDYQDEAVQALYVIDAAITKAEGR